MSTHATASAQRPTVAITMGDPAGIGPELCLRALAEATLRQECTIVIFGDISVLARVANLPTGDVLWQPGGGRVAAPDKSDKRPAV